MTRDRLMHLSERWFTLLQRLYPPDFRDEMGVSAQAAARTGLRIHDYRDAHHRARHVRRRVHGDAENPHRPDALQRSGRSVLRVGGFAPGADHGRVLRLVLKEGAVLVMMGLLIGASGIYIAGGLIRGVLVGVCRRRIR